MNNILDKTKKTCYGCGACVTVCPVNAITYQLNEKGFYEPNIIQEKCVECGKCKQVCLKYKAEDKIQHPIREGSMLAARSKDPDTVLSCTSGGIAYEIAKYGIEKGYKVLGTVYDYKQNIAKAIIATKLCELEPIKGSKYIQSKVDEAFISLKEDCLQNYDAKYIVFGTPCQLVGLTNILEKEKIKNEIIKIDLFCHGVPSYHLWQAYRKWLKEKYGIETLEQINFRSKHIGWHDFCMEIHAGNHHYYRSSEGDYFYKAFFDNIVLQQACLTCEARMNRSDADIRLGDYWGKRYIHNQKGISAVLVLTETGRQWMEQLAKDRVEVLEETSVQDCIQAQSVEPYSYQKLNIDTLANIQTAKNIQQLIKQYRKKMSKKYRVKKALKESTAWMPDTWRSQIRRLSHKIR